VGKSIGISANITIMIPSLPGAGVGGGKGRTLFQRIPGGKHTDCYPTKNEQHNAPGKAKQGSMAIAANSVPEIYEPAFHC
jgi:hypothetical protein